MLVHRLAIALRSVPFVLALLMTLGIGPTAAIAAQPAHSEPVSGEAFWKQWYSPAAVTWSGIPLRAALDSIARQWNVAVFLDRRVDPDQLIDFSSSEQPLGQMVHRMAEQLHLSVSPVDAVLYFAPPGVAPRVATMAEIQFDQAQRQGWSSLVSRRRLEWPWLAEPRQLIQQVASGASWQVDSPHQIEHDLWAGNRLPPIPVTHQLALLLAGFELTFDLDGATRTLKLVPLPEAPVLVREYPATRLSLARKQELASHFPDVRFEWLANRLRATGVAEDHYLLRRELLGLTPEARPTAGQLRYTLRTANRFEPLARAIAQRLGLAVQIDPSVSEIRNRLITIDVQNVTREQLLQALVDTVGWQYEITGNQLKLFPKKDR
ncbi:MAG: hypothetical protein KatS3mg110_1679 [Pirellulaceae bacterium]|nr:MAG: hypothetical protein KatS3mg110_1679 [Pirellulaceae bacterium]